MKVGSDQSRSCRGEGMYRMDANPCALKSSRHQLSHAQGLKSKSRTVASEYSIENVEILEISAKCHQKIEILTPKNTNLGSECLKIWKMRKFRQRKFHIFRICANIGGRIHTNIDFCEKNTKTHIFEHCWYHGLVKFLQRYFQIWGFNCALTKEILLIT